MSCDGCTISVAGATNPGIEGLLLGTVPAMPKVILHHPVLSVEAGADFVQSFADAGPASSAPRTSSCYEGSVADERIAERTGGYFCGDGRGGDQRIGRGVAAGAHRHLAASARAPGAAATIAIGTCATWGGVPRPRATPPAR